MIEGEGSRSSNVNLADQYKESGRGLLEVYWVWTDSASAGDQEEVY